MSYQIGMIVAHSKVIPLFSSLDLHRAEFCLIEPEAKWKLDALIAANGLKYGVHCPLYKPADHPEKNSLLSSIVDGEEERRLESVGFMKQAIRDAEELGGEYVVVHAQRPENFGGDNPAGFDEAAALDSAKRGCECLLSESQRRGIPVFIENLFHNRAFYSPASFSALLESFPEFGFCLDIGHLDVDSREFGFPFDEFLDAVMPYLREIHLQNSTSRPTEEVPRPWKYPVHPSQKPEDGWCDIPAILEKILCARPYCLINFESRIMLPDDEQVIREGMEWIKGLVPELLGNCVYDD